MSPVLNKINNKSFNVSEFIFLVFISVMSSIAAYIIHKNSTLWTDEFIMLITAKRGILESLFQLEDYSAPLYQMLLRLFIKEEFPPEWIVRFPAYLFMILGLISTWYFTKCLFGRRVGIITILLLSTNPFFLRYGAEARPYSMFLFFSVTSMGIFYKIITSDNVKIKHIFLYVITTTLLLYTHFYGVLLLFSQILYFFATIIIRDYNWRQKKIIGFAFLIIIIFSIPSFLLAMRYILSGAKGTIGWIARPRMTDLIWLRQTGELLGDQILSVLCVISIISALYFDKLNNNKSGKNDNIKYNNKKDIIKWWINRDTNMLCVFWIICSLYSLIVISYIGRPIYVKRYGLPVLVPIIILIAVLLCRIRALPRIAIFMAIIILPLSTSIDFIFLDRLDYKHTITKLREINHERSTVFVTDGTYCENFINPEIYGMRYYGYNEQELKLLFLRYPKPVEIAEPVMIPEDKRFFVIAYVGKSAVEDYLKKNLRNYRIFTYGNLSLFEVQKVYGKLMVK
jgi:uncharacterized membrane protein